MALVSVDVRDLNGAVLHVKSLKMDLDKAPNKAARSLAYKFRDKILQRVTTEGITWEGKLITNTEVRKTDEGSYAVLMPRYAVYVDRGTRPHVISSRSKRAVRWGQTKGPGFWQMRKAIATKGAKPHPFITPAAEELARETGAFAADFLDKIMIENGFRRG